MAEDTIEDIEMASSFKEEMLSEPVLFSDQEMSLDSRQFSDQEMLSDPLAEDASMDNFSKADGAEEPQFTSLKTYGERGPSTVKMMVIDAEAEYDRTFKRYVYHATFFSRQPFVMKTQTVKKDRHGRKRKFGTVFFEGRAAGPFRFLDLPAEIRIMVYELVLCSPPCTDGKWKDGKPIVKDNDPDAWDADVDKDNAVVRDDKRDEIYHSEIQFGRHGWNMRMKYPFQDGRQNLLLVSKQINSESSAVLYGTSIFRFDDSNTMLTFLLKIGNNRRHLQRVRLIGTVAPTSATPASRMLAEATRLQFLQIKYTMSGIYRLSNYHSKTVFEVFRTLFDMLFARDLDYDNVLNNQIVIRTSPCYCHNRHMVSLDWKCLICRHATVISDLEKRHSEKALEYWEKNWGKRLEQEREEAEENAKLAQRQKTKPTKSKQASKNRKRSHKEYDDDDEADTLDASVPSLPAPEPARKMPGRRAKSMASYEAQLSDDEEATEQSITEMTAEDY